MLFDLYSIQNREKDFEQLALDYAMRFETSPPVLQKLAATGRPSPSSRKPPAWIARSARQEGGGHPVRMASPPSTRKPRRALIFHASR